MAYSPTTWVNDSPPNINAANLNKIEQAIKDAHDRLDTAGVSVSGAVGDGVADDTSAVQDALAEAIAQKRDLSFPAGTFSVSSLGVLPEGMTVRGSGMDRTVIKARSGNSILLDADGGRNAVYDLTLDGNDHTGEIGLRVGKENKFLVQNVAARNFNHTGVVLDGSQNGALINVSSYLNKYNFWLTNAARNIVFVACNATYSSPGHVTAWETANSPDCRNILVKKMAHPLVPLQTGAPAGRDTPSRLTFVGGIYERAGDQDHNVEIVEAWDGIQFLGTELHGCASALISVTRTQDPAVYISMVAPTLEYKNRAGANHNIFEVIETAARSATAYPVRISVTGLMYPVSPSIPWNYPVEIGITTADYEPHVLQSPIDFRRGAGHWQSSGGGASITWDSARRHIVITGDSVFGARCPWLQSFAHTEPFDSDTYITVTVDARELAGTVTVNALLKAAPWRREIGTLNAEGVHTFEYQFQGDESPQGIEVSPGAGNTARLAGVQAYQGRMRPTGP